MAELKTDSLIVLYADHDTIPTPRIYAKQYDKASRFITVRIMLGDEQLIINSRCRLNAVKPDGKKCFAEGTVNEDGTVTFELTSNFLAIAGNIRCDVSVFDTDNNEQIMLTSSTFYVVVEHSFYDENALISTDEWSGAEDTLNRINAFLDKMKELEIDVPIATKDTPGKVQPGNGLDVDENGVVSLSAATANSIGGVKPGNNISLANDGTISVPVATASTLGVMKPGSGCSVNEKGEFVVPEYTLPDATSEEKGGIVLGDFLSKDQNGKVSAIVQFVDSNAEASATNYGKYRIVIGENSTAEMQVCSRTAVDGEENAFTYQWDTVQLYSLPAASSSTLGGVKIGSGVTAASDGTISVPPSTPDFVYECTGAADDTAIAALIDAFFATDKTSFSLDIMGDFGGVGTLNIESENDKGQSVYLNFAGCNTGSTLETISINTTGSTAVFISNIKAHGSFCLTIKGTGRTYIKECEIITSGRTYEIDIDSGAYVFISNSFIGHINPTWRSTNVLQNKGTLYITNSGINGVCDNHGTLYGNNLHKVTAGAYLTIISNRGIAYVSNSDLLGCVANNGSDAVFHIDNCNVHNSGIPFSMNGTIYINNTTWQQGSSGSGTNNTFTGSALIINNCEFVTNTRIVCNTANSKVKITNSIFHSSGTDSTAWAGGGLILGTDDTTIPQFYVSGNTFETAGVRIGGNDVTYVTASNGQYMPEFANTFAEVTTE